MESIHQHKLTLHDLQLMDRDLIRHLALQFRFIRLACYRISDEEATLILDTGDESQPTWPAKINCGSYYSTSKKGTLLASGWCQTPLSLIKEYPNLKSAKSYLPPQDLWSTKLLFLIKTNGRSVKKIASLDGFLEMLSRRFHFWVAGDELRHFIDDTTTSEQMHSFDSFLSKIVAHEMRNPVANLLSLTYAEESTSEGQSLMEPKQFAGEVKIYAQKIWEIIQKFELLASEPTDLTSDISTPTKFDLKMILDTEIKHLNQNFDHEDKSTINLKIADGTFIVEGTFSLVSLALREVLKNAIIYGNGTVIDTFLYKSGHHLVLDIADDGPSIAPGQDELIFLRYFQGPAPTTSRSRLRRGLGLGLYLARFITSMHNGQLLFVRGIGKKGVFRFIWPEAK